MEKVVLARPIDFHAHAPLESADVLAQLLGTYACCKVFALRPPQEKDAPAPIFLGATPECLVRLHEDDTLYIDALAGTVAAASPDAALFESAKDRHEHALVISAIREAMQSVATLSIPAAPFVDHLANVKHLRTPVTGKLERREDLFSLAARLHPTPAVCGRPRELARRWILEHERPLGLERGWYAGALGWCSAAGHGELDVALRCALLDHAHARLFVGAGIVSGSCGEDELEETGLKARALARALMPPDEEARHA